MGKIGLLDISVANMIAAGEVVDRPASVIKELMENSIDAGATELTVEIKNGGISLMRVSDNGCGMAREDATLCISRHATSKIRSAADLDGIVTLGFRGEALAAISAVSTVRIMTRRKEDSMGTLVHVEAGNIRSVEEAGCRAGTTIIVEELFANVPARRKFLKKDQSEAMAIAAVVEKIALSRPDIAIHLISDGQSKLHTAGDNQLLHTIYALFGREFASKLIPVEGMTGGIGCRGYIGRPDQVRANRNYQNFFINGRYIKSRTAAAALEQAFSSFLESERFPCCILSLTIHPSSVDVNVHPTKLEVKFSNEHAVFDAVYGAVRNALLSDTARPEMAVPDPAERPTPKKEQLQNAYRSFTPIPEGRGEERSRFRQVTVEQTVTAPEPPPTLPPSQGQGSFTGIEEGLRMGMEQLAQQLTGSRDVKAIFEPEEGFRMPKQAFPPQASPAVPPPAPAPAPAAEAWQPDDPPQEALPPYRLLGVAFGTYILVELPGKLLLIDQHAAHERILFEDMKKRLQSRTDRYGQVLLLPLELPLSREEAAAAMEQQAQLEAIGFAYQIEGERAILREIPGGLQREQASDFFVTLCGQLASGTGNISVSTETLFERALYQASCKAAIKGGRTEAPEHLRYLVEKLLRIPNLRYCPHGRPVAFELTKANIEHQFKRA